MCLYPKLIINKKYTPTKKNKGRVPILYDERIKYVSIGCGNCIECRKKKSREWQIRLTEEIKGVATPLIVFDDMRGCDIAYTLHPVMVTLTFSEESLTKLSNEIEATPTKLLDNAIATLAVRRFLGRYRKKYKKSLKHWLVTELGHKNTERIHLHGIIWVHDPSIIDKLWSYGYTYLGKYVNNQTINYIVKYITKTDIEHYWFKPKILSSPGIGKNYINTYNSKLNKFKNEKTDETYKNSNGTKSSLPIYYRNKIYSEKDREYLWLNKLDQELRYVLGKKIDISSPAGEKLYEEILTEARIKNLKLGYGKDNRNPDEKLYRSNCKNIKNLTKLAKKKKKI